MLVEVTGGGAEHSWTVLFFNGCLKKWWTDYWTTFSVF